MRNRDDPQRLRINAIYECQWKSAQWKSPVDLVQRLADQRLVEEQ
jgi:hypothetical protein